MTTETPPALPAVKKRTPNNICPHCGGPRHFVPTGWAWLTRSKRKVWRCSEMLCRFP